MAVAECILIATCILSNFYHQPKLKVKKIVPIVCRATNKYNIKVEYPLAIMYYESRFTHNLRSKTDDIGIMQLHCPKNAIGPTCNKCNVKEISCNINRGIRLLYLRKKKYQSKYKEPYRWIQHYNFHSKKYAEKIYNKAQASLKSCVSVDTFKVNEKMKSSQDFICQKKPTTQPHIHTLQKCSESPRNALEETAKVH